MATSNERLRAEISDDQLYAHLPGVGRVPMRPRGSRYWQHRRPGTQIYPDHYRPNYDDHRQSPEIKTEEVGTSLNDVPPHDETSEIARLRILLAENDAKKRQEMQEANESFRNMDIANQSRYQDQIGGRTQRTNNSSIDSSSCDEPIIQHESSEELEEGEVRQTIEEHQSNSSELTNPRQERSSRPVSATETLSNILSVPLNRSNSSKPISSSCHCPVGLECEARDDKNIDCRTLVLEWTRWKKRNANDDQPQIPEDLPPEEEHFLGLEDAMRMIKLIDNIQSRSRLSQGLRSAYSSLRSSIRKMQHNSMTQDILDESGLLNRLKFFLSEDNREMRQRKMVPDNIIEDLTILQTKWEFGDLSVLPCRGLIRGNGGIYSIDRNWPWVRNGRVLGTGPWVNGQTWHSRSAMSRDGIHRPLQAGISGTAEEGAESVVMGYHDEKREQYYADVDEGNTVYYIGTALLRQKGDKEPTNLKDSEEYELSRITKNSRGEGPTNATKALMTSCRTGDPVRLIRSWRLADIVPSRPYSGYRYDGTYVVESFELLKLERQIYRFKMVRTSEGQGPLRLCEAPLGPEKRKKNPADKARKRKKE